MKVKLAKTAGFCYGVERAVNAVYDEVKRNKSADAAGAGSPADKSGTAEGGSGRIFTYGPIVHNEMVVDDLRKQGVDVIDGMDDLEKRLKDGSMKGATVIIRAHGVGREVTDLLEDPDNGIRVVDATCPFVKKIHDIVREHHDKGEQIIITGTRTHPEVQGILGQIGFDAEVVETTEEAEILAEKLAGVQEQSLREVQSDGETASNKAVRQCAEGQDDAGKDAESAPEGALRYCLVSQTTFNTQKFKDIVDIFEKKLYYGTVVNTICNATQLRQKEALALSRECDAMIVIGGKHSSNTAKLYDICSKECSATYFIESLDDLNETIDQSVRCFGITAGASTPKTIIQEVLKYVRDEF